MIQIYRYMFVLLETYVLFQLNTFRGQQRPQYYTQLKHPKYSSMRPNKGVLF